jgi:hypothetical protein
VPYHPPIKVQTIQAREKAVKQACFDQASKLDRLSLSNIKAFIQFIDVLSRLIVADRLATTVFHDAFGHEILVAEGVGGGRQQTLGRR